MTSENKSSSAAGTKTVSAKPNQLPVSYHLSTAAGKITSKVSGGQAAKTVREIVVAALKIYKPDFTMSAVAAKDMGAELKKAGFHQVLETRLVQMGDIAVFPAIDGNSEGHVQIYAGYAYGQGASRRPAWVSDFIQTDQYPNHAYRDAKTAFTMFRFTKKLHEGDE